MARRRYLPHLRPGGLKHFPSVEKIPLASFRRGRGIFCPLGPAHGRPARGLSARGGAPPHGGESRRRGTGPPARRQPRTHRRGICQREICQREICQREICQRGIHRRGACQRGIHRRRICQRGIHRRRICQREIHRRASAQGRLHVEGQQALVLAAGGGVHQQSVHVPGKQLLMGGQVVEEGAQFLPADAQGIVHQDVSA